MVSREPIDGLKHEAERIYVESQLRFAVEIICGCKACTDEDVTGVSLSP